MVFGVDGNLISANDCHTKSWIGNETGAQKDQAMARDVPTLTAWKDARFTMTACLRSTHLGIPP
jgi:hypothetical protein